jgi:transposase-like protein
MHFCWLYYSNASDVINSASTCLRTAEQLLKAAGLLAESVELRQVKYLNNLIEQDHRFIKRLVKPVVRAGSKDQAKVVPPKSGQVFL